MANSKSTSPLHRSSLHRSSPHRSSPFMTWAKVCAPATYNLANSGILAYSKAEQDEFGIDMASVALNGSNPYGIEEVKEKIATIYKVKSTQILLTPSVSMANFLVMSVLLDAGDDVLIEKPVYEPFLSNAKFLKANILIFERSFVKNFQPDIDEIRSKITKKTKLIILSSPHNPSGMFVEQKNLTEIGKIAEQNGTYVLVDEIFRDIDPEAKEIAFKLGDNFISTNGFAKCYGFGALRFGWVISNDKTIDKLKLLIDLIGICNPYAVDMVAGMLLDKRETILNRARDLLKSNRAYFIDFLTQCSGCIESKISEWGVVAFPRFTKNFKELCPNSEILYQKLRESSAESQTSFAPGSFFDEKCSFRIGYGGEPRLVKEGLSNLAVIINNY